MLCRGNLLSPYTVDRLIPSHHIVSSAELILLAGQTDNYRTMIEDIGVLFRDSPHYNVFILQHKITEDTINVILL